MATVLVLKLGRVWQLHCYAYEYGIKHRTYHIIGQAPTITESNYRIIYSRKRLVIASVI